jgi:hypothetical protein
VWGENKSIKADPVKRGVAKYACNRGYAPPFADETYPDPLVKYYIHVIYSQQVAASHNLFLLPLLSRAVKITKTTAIRLKKLEGLQVASC